MSDNLGTRMKEQYENRVRYALPRRTYTLIRVDGKAFHTFTKGCQRPYDESLVAAFNVAGLTLCAAAQGVEMAYLQSDELSFLLTDFASDKTEAWFDGNVQKITSIAASVVTAAFNRYWKERHFADHQLAFFDARVWTIPDPTEVENYFIWRQQDATRNSISMLAQHHFSHRELQGKSGPEMQELLHSERGINWNDQPSAFKRGRTIIHDDNGWEVEPDIPIFTTPEGREWLRRRIPRYA